MRFSPSGPRTTPGSADGGEPEEQAADGNSPQGEGVGREALRRAQAGPGCRAAAGSAVDGRAGLPGAQGALYNQKCRRRHETHHQEQ